MTVADQYLSAVREFSALLKMRIDQAIDREPDPLLSAVYGTTVIEASSMEEMAEKCRDYIILQQNAAMLLIVNLAGLVADSEGLSTMEVLQRAEEAVTDDLLGRSDGNASA